MKKQHLAAAALACIVTASLVAGTTAVPQETPTNDASSIELASAVRSTVIAAAEDVESTEVAIEEAAAEQAAEKKATEMEAARKAAQAANTSFSDNRTTESSKSANRMSASSNKSNGTSTKTASASTRTITIDGVTMSYSDSYGASSAPNSGAGIWKGSDSTTDGSYSYYIGHNPGSFSAAANANNGSQITVNDSNGNSRTYTVVDTFVVSKDSNWSDVSGRVTNHGESVALQTCVDAGYKIIVAE